MNDFSLTEHHQKLISTVFKNKSIQAVSIKGFADTAGRNLYNIELSRKRANAVYEYLMKQNFTDSTVVPEYFGEKFSTNENPEYNRRVDIVIVQKPSDETIHQDPGVVIRRFEISNIYFVPDKAIIEAHSFSVVEKMAKELSKLNGCRYEIIGHVNYVLSESVKRDSVKMAPIQKLSEDRAKAVFDLFAGMGIPDTVMSYRGAGVSQMIYTNPVTEEQKRKNMRVEIIVYCNRN